MAEPSIEVEIVENAAALTAVLVCGPRFMMQKFLRFPWIDGGRRSKPRFMSFA
jgi:hypothetical protein